LMLWQQTGKPMSLWTNGTQQAIQASMASTNNAQMNQQSPNNTPITT
jgi:hypothetical protein